MCVNNLPRVALDSGVAGIRTRDLVTAQFDIRPVELNIQFIYM